MYAFSSQYQVPTWKSRNPLFKGSTVACKEDRYIIPAKWLKSQSPVQRVYCCMFPSDGYFFTALKSQSPVQRVYCCMVPIAQIVDYFI